MFICLFTKLEPKCWPSKLLAASRLSWSVETRLRLCTRRLGKTSAMFMFLDIAKFGLFECFYNAKPMGQEQRERRIVKELSLLCLSMASPSISMQSLKSAFRVQLRLYLQVWEMTLNQISWQTWKHLEFMRQHFDFIVNFIVKLLWNLP